MLYFISGLHLQPNEPLAGLPLQTGNSRADVQVRLGETLPELERLLATEELWYVSSDLDERERPLLTISTVADGAYFRMVYGDGNEFLIDRRGTQVSGVWSTGMTIDDRTSYLLGPVLSFVLCLRGVTCLHASAISIAGKAVAFVGPEGAGKSTTAAAFAGRGYPVLADDIVALCTSNETLLAQPGYPRLRLRSNALSTLYDTTANSPRLLPTADHQFSDLDLLQEGYKFEERALPLAAIYFLSEPGDDAFTPEVDWMAGGEGLMSLIANTWATRVLDPSMRAREFRTLSQLSAKVPLRRVRAGARRSSPDTLCESILNDFHKIDSGATLIHTNGL